MKKYLLPLLAVAALFGCQKEQEEIDTPVKPEGVAPVYTITGHITEPIMKTAYDFVSDPSKGDFSWVAGDQVDLILLNGGSFSDTTPVTLSAETPTDGGKTVVFTNLLSEHASPSERFSIDTWESSGFAVYPQGLAKDNSSCPYSSPYVKLRSTVGGVASEIALVGTPDNDVTPTNFNFKTAMGVLKVTLTDIPAEAASLKLTTTNKATDPLDGDFSLIKNGSGIVEITKSNYLVTGVAPNGNGQGFIQVDLSALGAIASRDFYFNIPTGDYAAGTLSLTLANGSGEELLHKTINKNLTFTRGTVIAAKSLANEWVTLGTGRFIDNLIWQIQGKTDYSSVNIQRNVADNTQYRIHDPYGTGSDSYFYFTITAGKEVSFTNYDTNVTYSSISQVISCVGSANDRVLLGTGSDPKIVELAPNYSSWTRSSYANMIKIVFPGVTNDDYGITISASSAALSSFNITFGSKLSYARVVMHQSYRAHEIANGRNGFQCKNYTTYPSIRTGLSGSQVSYNLMGSTQLTSGLVYVSWFAGESDSNIYLQGSVPLYYISSDDITAICKKHTTSGNKGTSSDGAYTGSYTFEVSEDATNSNIKMTEFDGLCCDVSEMAEPASTHQIYSSLTWIAPGTTTYTGADPVFTDGSAQYGILSGSNILLDASQPFFHRGSVNVYVFSYTDYAGSGRGAANNPERFKFTISEGKVNVGETYVNARFDGNNQASAPYANTISED